MADIFSPEKRSQVMALIRSTGNKGTEIKLMTMLRQAQIRGWRRHVVVRAGRATGAVGKGVKVRPDFVFWHARVAVFVDGCFWHGCPRHGRLPEQNGAFWEEKIFRNRSRDRKVNRALRAEGWTVLRVWECALVSRRIMATLARIQRAVERGDEK